MGRRALSTSAAALLLTASMMFPENNGKNHLQQEHATSLLQATSPVSKSATSVGIATSSSMPESTSWFLDPKLRPLVLISAASMTFAALVAVVTIAEGVGPAGWLTYESCQHTLPTSLSLFVASDLVAQKITGKKLDLKRSMWAGLIGCLVNSFGFGIFLHYIEALIPSETVGLLGGSKMAANLFVKTILDSFVWGTISNSLSILLRRLSAGDSLLQAFHVWKGLIMEVFGSEFKFWPYWQGACYSMIPVESRVQWVALGAFLWNTYLSMKSASAKQVPDCLH